MAGMSANGSRTCCVESRSRSVAVPTSEPPSSESKSIVMAYGMPSSSARAYLLPMEAPDSSTLYWRPFSANPARAIASRLPYWATTR
eukprot:scaffold131813_cov29-Tisochrysis_lutea.AAC.1